MVKSEYNERLRAQLMAHEQKYLQPLYDLVACDTRVVGHGILGGYEANGQAYLERLFKTLGAYEIVRDGMDEAQIQSAIKTYREGNPGHDYEGRYNLYTRFKGQSDKHLIFNGHIDTMPYGELSAWTVPPIEATLKEDRIYGLGVCDMKGGLMAAAMAVKLLEDTGIPRPCEVSIISVVDEEGGGNGSIQAAMKGIRGDGLVVCEPTERELIVAHMGFVFYKVRIKGRANHSGAKWLGVSAIEKAVKMIERLTQLEAEWQAAYEHPLLPKPNLNVGTIHGGSAASTVAGECTFEVCIHYHPNTMSYERVEADFYNAIEDKDDDWLLSNPPVVTMYQSGGPFEMDVTHPLVDAFKDAFQMATGETVKVAGSPAGCDSRIWKGIAKTPTLQFGPGALAQCHAADEYLEKSAYLECILIYANLMLSFGTEDGTRRE